MRPASALGVLLWFCLMPWQPILADEVRLAVPMNLQPYYMPREARGLAYEAIQAAFALRGHQLIPIYTSKRTIENILASNPAVDCSGLQSDETAARWPSTNSPLPMSASAFSLAGSPWDIDSTEDLASRSILAYPGASAQLGPAYRTAIAGASQYREIYNYRAQLKLLLRQRVDVVVTDRLLTQWYLPHLKKELGFTGNIRYFDLSEPIFLHFVCRKPGVLEDFVAGMQAIRANGGLDQILKRYLPVPKSSLQN